MTDYPETSGNRRGGFQLMQIFENKYSINKKVRKRPLRFPEVSGQSVIDDTWQTWR